MNATQKARLAIIESTLSTEAGVQVEVTIRGDRSFTWSFPGRNDAAAEILSSLAERQNSTAEISTVDLGDGEFHTCVYVEATEL